MTTYKDVYQSWQTDPEGFWLDAAKAIDWVKAPKVAPLPTKDGKQEWFADAMVNTC